VPKPQDKHFPQQSTSACLFPYLRKAIDASGCGADGYAERLQKRQWEEEATEGSEEDGFPRRRQGLVHGVIRCIHVKTRRRGEYSAAE